MKYKVGDKVRIREDLVMGVDYGCAIVVDDMKDMGGSVVTIERVCGNGYYIEEDPDEYCWTDEMFEPVEEELTAEEAIKVLADMCTRECKNCELGKLVKESKYSFCSDYRREHPDKVVEILKQWKKDHEKKEIEIELAYVVRVIEDTGKVKRCVYEEDVTEVKEEAMKRVLKEYCKEHDGKFFTVYEEICRVKE
jgi:hypothetical protein